MFYSINLCYSHVNFYNNSETNILNLARKFSKLSIVHLTQRKSIPFEFRISRDPRQWIIKKLETFVNRRGLTLSLSLPPSVSHSLTFSLSISHPSLLLSLSLSLPLSPPSYFLSLTPLSYFLSISLSPLSLTFSLYLSHPSLLLSL